MAVLTCLKSPAPESLVSIPLLRRIRAEYVEMPGLKLTAAQAQRLWGLDGATCDTLLAALVDVGFLSRTGTGLFVIAATTPSYEASRTGSGMPGVSDIVGARHARADPFPGQHDSRPNVWGDAERAGAQARATTSTVRSMR